MKPERSTFIRVIAINMLMLCFALSISLLGQMFSAIKAQYNISLSQGGLLLSVQSIGGLLLSILCILFIRAINKNKLLVICGFVLCCSMLLVGALLPLALMFLLFILLGFSGGAINALTNATLADTVPQRSERYINFMHMLFSFGSVIAPVLSQALFPSVGLTGVFLIFGGFALCWALFSVFAFTDQLKMPLATGTFSLLPRFRDAVSVLKTPGMAVIFVIAMLITAWQLSAIYYISTFFTGITGLPMKGALALSLLFLGMMLSRLIYARIADRFPKGRVLLLTNAVGLFAWAAVFIVQDVTAKYVFVTLAALACGNNFPITFSAACRLVPHNTAAASSFVNLGYYVSIFVFIPIIGTLGDSIGLSTALLMSGAALMLILPLSLLLHRQMKT